ncbi:MAG: DUF4301 family protein [Deltaproteobacteria bacterium]|nr:DUF4301 family protein [Deltaproteobacteria bacterium]
MFNEDDIKQIKDKGITPERVLSRIEIFKKGFPFSKLLRPCIVNDGIIVLKDDDLERLEKVYSQAATSGRAMKFVPASGAATRMVKLLLSIYNRYKQIDEKVIRAEAEKGDPEHKAFLEFIQMCKRFAFYDDLKSEMARDGLDVEVLISQGRYRHVLEYTLTAKGINIANSPKGLIKFHLYPDHSRTPFEEHMVEAAEYSRDGEGIVRLHFTVSQEHEVDIKDYIEEIRGRYERSGVRYDMGFSTQKPSTDTMAVDMDNQPFRDSEGRLLFRPGGHGALLENLSDLHGDIIFIKNIDNVVPDRLKQETYRYKKALGGYLIELQDRIFGYLKQLSNNDVDKDLTKQSFEFAENRLSIFPTEEIAQGTEDKKIAFIVSRLNRPLRVCGMVKNVGEPGGGPFWVDHAGGSSSVQIVELSQVDMSSAQQKAIWESSTHFNPVDLVCGVRDYLGRPFDLSRYVDPDTGFISVKSKEGRDLKALELPGLWNGSMAKWNTVFVEVPIITFNPVKTVLDLLRREHQPV